MADRFEPHPGSIIQLERGDITYVRADAIVNAANSHLARGGGVCGAIHAAGGPEIAREAQAWVTEHGEVPVGGATPTTAGALPARWVIHAVGPVWHGGHSREAELLSSAYRSALDRADELGARSVAFPSISTGIFGYPVEKAAPVALSTIAEELNGTEHVRFVTFILFDQRTYSAYERALSALAGTLPSEL